MERPSLHTRQERCFFPWRLLHAPGHEAVAGNPSLSLSPPPSLSCATYNTMAPEEGIWMVVNEASLCLLRLPRPTRHLFFVRREVGVGGIGCARCSMLHMRLAAPYSAPSAPWADHFPALLSPPSSTPSSVLHHQGAIMSRWVGGSKASKRGGGERLQGDIIRIKRAGPWGDAQ